MSSELPSGRMQARSASREAAFRRELARVAAMSARARMLEALRLGERADTFSRLLRIRDGQTRADAPGRR